MNRLEACNDGIKNQERVCQQEIVAKCLFLLIHVSVFALDFTLSPPFFTGSKRHDAGSMKHPEATNSSSLSNLSPKRAPSLPERLPEMTWYSEHGDVMGLHEIQSDSMGLHEFLIG